MLEAPQPLSHPTAAPTFRPDAMRPASFDLVAHATGGLTGAPAGSRKTWGFSDTDSLQGVRRSLAGANAATIIRLVTVGIAVTVSG